MSKLDLEPIQPSDEGFDYRQIGTRQLSVRRRCQFYRSRAIFNSTTLITGQFAKGTEKFSSIVTPGHLRCPTPIEAIWMARSI